MDQDCNFDVVFLSSLFLCSTENLIDTSDCCEKFENFFSAASIRTILSPQNKAPIEIYVMIFEQENAVLCKFELDL